MNPTPISPFKFLFVVVIGMLLLWPTSKSRGADVVAAPDKASMTKMAEGGMAEVAASQAVADKLTSAEWKKFAGEMITDHGKANAELAALAKSQGVTLPAETDKMHQDAIAKLAAMPAGDALDAAYAKMMVKDHTGAVALFKKVSTTSKDAELKEWATKTLPTLEGHLKMAEGMAPKK